MLALQTNEDSGVKTYTVYRFDYIRQERELVGKVLERRGKDRGNNAEALWRLARKLYSTSSLDSHIVITPDSVHSPVFPSSDPRGAGEAADPARVIDPLTIPEANH
jgi:hypothetical protein